MITLLADDSPAIWAVACTLLGLIVTLTTFIVKLAMSIATLNVQVQSIQTALSTLITDLKHNPGGYDGSFIMRSMPTHRTTPVGFAIDKNHPKETAYLNYVPGMRSTSYSHLQRRARLVAQRKIDAGTTASEVSAQTVGRATTKRRAINTAAILKTTSEA